MVAFFSEPPRECDRWCGEDRGFDLGRAKTKTIYLMYVVVKSSIILRQSKNNARAKKNKIKKIRACSLTRVSFYKLAKYCKHTNKDFLT